MEKKPFLTEAMAQEIIQDVPTPFHVYDEKGIRENARRINKAFSWNKGFKEYFAVKALPNPVILQILKEEGCGVDCSSLTELMLSEVCGFSGSDIMFSSNQTPVEDMKKAYELGAYINLDDATMVEFLERVAGVPENIAALSEKLSRRHFSIGADGIICICAPRTAGADAMMRIFNADGSEGRMCGNGIRCVAEWLYTHGIAKETLAIDTLSGLKTVTHKGAGLWQVEMGAYSAMPASLPAVNMGEEPLVDKELTVDGKTWHVTCISVGNPHCVTVVEDVDSLKLEEIGPAFEHHANFPERINTEFVQVVDPTHLKMRVWERGSGETWACGTGTCATVAALTELGICPAGEDIHVQLRGGVLTIRVLPGRQLLMTGAAETVCEGTTEV